MTAGEHEIDQAATGMASPLGRSAGSRLLWAAAIGVFLWLAVWWALT